MKAIPVCTVDQLPYDSMRAFQVAGRDIVFVRNGERIYALRNFCPHQGATLSLGVLSCRRIAAEVGEYRTQDDSRVVRCPWHNWEFDIADGTAVHDPERVRVATYRAYITEGRVYVVL